MVQEIKNVMVIGAGGNVGKPVLQALLDSAAFNVSVLTRPSSTSTFPPTVRVHKTEYTETALVTVFQGQDAIISTVNFLALPDQKMYIDAAIKAGVKRFFPSEFSVDSLDPAVLELLPFFHQKKEIIEYLRIKESEGLTWTGFCTGLFFDWGLRIGLLQFSLLTQTASLWDTGSTPFPTTTLATVGAALVHALLHPAASANKYLRIASFTPTHNEILAALEKATAKRWEVQWTTTEAQVSAARELMAKGDVGTGMLPLVLAAAFGKVEGREGREGGEDNKVVGVGGEDLEKVVKAVADGM
ncbi:hypothetical protein MMC30_008992 [Trapelia coarctata]|nr:hypothetical protein [Trapelia coarctata]